MLQVLFLPKQQTTSWNSEGNEKMVYQILISGYQRATFSPFRIIAFLMDLQKPSSDLMKVNGNYLGEEVNLWPFPASQEKNGQKHHVSSVFKVQLKIGRKQDGPTINSGFLCSSTFKNCAAGSLQCSYLFQFAPFFYILHLIQFHMDDSY